MSEEVVLKARIRARSGTGLVRRLRKEGDVPAVLYGTNKDNLSIAVDHDLLFHNLEREEFSSQVITIDVDGNQEKAILRDVQRHPHKVQILHADFQRVDENKPIHIAIPIHFTGEEECVGVRIDGGLISRLMNELEVTCLPKDLPEAVEIDITNLHLGESIHLSDIKLPEGVEITSLPHVDDVQEHDNAVIAIQAPRVEVEVEETETDGMPADTDSADDSDADGDEGAEEK